MNVELLTKIAEWLEAGAPHEQNRGMRFDMEHIIMLPSENEAQKENWCGTSCCIAGAAIAFSAPQILKELHLHQRFDGEATTDGWDDGVDLLDLDEGVAQYLFAPWDYEYPEEVDDRQAMGRWANKPEKITPAWAGRTIRHLIATGKVRWDLTHDDAVPA